MEKKVNIQIHQIWFVTNHIKLDLLINLTPRIQGTWKNSEVHRL
jgi:hypothetical protein